MWTFLSIDFDIISRSRTADCHSTLSFALKNIRDEPLHIYMHTKKYTPSPRIQPLLDLLHVHCARWSTLRLFAHLEVAGYPGSQIVDTISKSPRLETVASLPRNTTRGGGTWHVQVAEAAVVAALEVEWHAAPSYIGPYRWNAIALLSQSTFPLGIRPTRHGCIIGAAPS
uniref:Uncharacterized protein n=1 Tax=Moniliophthora roreri TaxID=221103 RepID=A0A0W0G534_MONRR